METNNSNHDKGGTYAGKAKGPDKLPNYKRNYIVEDEERKFYCRDYRDECSWEDKCKNCRKFHSNLETRERERFDRYKKEVERRAGGGDARGGKKQNLVKQALVEMEEKELGEKDAGREMVLETVETRDEPVPTMVKIQASMAVASIGDYDDDSDEDEDFDDADYFDGFKARLLLHFIVMGYSQKSLTSARSKIALWFSQEKIPITTRSIVYANAMVWKVYCSRDTVETFWQRCKNYIFDWWQSCLLRPKFWGLVVLLAVTVCGGVVALGVLHPLILIGAAIAGIAGYVLYRSRLDETGVIVTTDCETLPDYCTETTIDKCPAISDDAKLVPSQCKKCTEVRFTVGFTTAADAVWIPRLCSCNELNALTTRQLLPALGTPEERTRLWEQGCDYMLANLPPVAIQTEMTEDEMFEAFVRRYPVGRRTAIRNSFVLINGSYHIRECKSSCFVKREWLIAKALLSRNPRLISAKTDEYLTELGPKYWVWSKLMVETYWGTVEKCIKQRFIYTGGMTGDQIGAIFTHFVAMGFTVVEGDFSRYDGHNEVEALRAETRYYKQVFDDDWIENVERQQHTVGKTSTGHKFSCVGKVASGVANTTGGNTHRGFMVIGSYIKEFDIKSVVVVMQNGDDNVLFLEDAEEFDLPRFVEFCRRMGHKLEAVLREDPDYTEYCSQRFWNIGDQYVLGPKPSRVLAKTFISSNVTFMPHDMPVYCRQIAEGFKHYAWIPVLGGVVQNLTSTKPGRNKKVEKALARVNNEYKIQLKEKLDVDQDAVTNQFIKIYGFNPTRLNETLKTFHIEFGKEWRNELIDHMMIVDGVRTPSTVFEHLRTIG